MPVRGGWWGAVSVAGLPHASVVSCRTWLGRCRGGMLAGPCWIDIERTEAVMRTLVIGATRGTGRLVVDRLLSDGHEVRAGIRSESQAEPLEAAGAVPVLADLEGTDEALRAAIDGVDAVLFCAGSGSRTGPDATLRVDLHGAVRTIDLAAACGVERYIMLSSMAADDPRRGPEAITHYLAAKHAADRILATSGLAWTSVRPGGLTHDRPAGGIEVGVPRLERRGTIPRIDVAAVMAGCLDAPGTVGVAFEVLSGPVPIAEALAGVSG